MDDTAAAETSRIPRSFDDITDLQAGAFAIAGSLTMDGTQAVAFVAIGLALIAIDDRHTGGRS